MEATTRQSPGYQDPVLGQRIQVGSLGLTLPKRQVVDHRHASKPAFDQLIPQQMVQAVFLGYDDFVGFQSFRQIHQGSRVREAIPGRNGRLLARGIDESQADETGRPSDVHQLLDACCLLSGANHNNPPFERSQVRQFQKNEMYHSDSDKGQNQCTRGDTAPSKKPRDYVKNCRKNDEPQGESNTEPHQNTGKTRSQKPRVKTHCKEASGENSRKDRCLQPILLQ